MRRAPAIAPLSPSLIKHFAFATVAITGLLALFASGEDWGAAAQIKAIDDRNQLEITEVKKFGAKKLAAKIEYRDGGPPPEFNTEVSVEYGHQHGPTYVPRSQPPVVAGGYAAGAGYADPHASRPAADSRDGPSEAPPIPGIETKRPQVKARPEAAPLPTAEQIAALKASAIARSAGGGGSGGSAD